MEEKNLYPVIILANGKSRTSRKIPHLTRTSTSVQRKIDKIQRTNSMNLHLQCSHMEKERDVISMHHKKGEFALKKRKHSYKAQMTQYKHVQENRDQPEPITHHHHDFSLSVKERQEVKLRAYNLDFLNSVRRKKKPITNHHTIIRQLTNLSELQAKHRKEYTQAMGEIQQIQNQTRNFLQVKIPNRSIVEPERKSEKIDHQKQRPVLISSMRSRIKVGEKEVDRVQTRFQRLATELYPEKSLIRHRKESTDENFRALNADKEKTFRLFCENSAILQHSESDTIEQHNVINEGSSRHGNKSNLSDGNADEKSPLQLPSIRPKYQHSTSLSTVGEEDRSRTLVESHKEDKMRVWLGYKSKEEMTRAAANPPPYRRPNSKPATLANILESPVTGIVVDSTEGGPTSSDADVQMDGV